MPRPAKYKVDDLLDASRDLVLAGGAPALSVSAVARVVGAPSGSVYHRFPSRDSLAASVWLRTVRRFQEGYLACLGLPSPIGAARAAARHVVVWSREHPDDARLLLGFRSSDLVHGPWPDALQEENDAQRRALELGLRALCGRLKAVDAGEVRRVRMAVVDLPYAAVRADLASGQRPDPGLEDLVDDAASSLLAPLLMEDADGD